MVGESIRNASLSLPAHVYPMIGEIAARSEELAERWVDEESQRLNWDSICRLASDYANNRWRSTTWSFLAMYSVLHEGEPANASVSVRVSRTHGKTEIETASDTLHSVVTKLMQEINNGQTDEWYMRNLARMLPQKTADFVCMSVGVGEQLK